MAYDPLLDGPKKESQPGQINDIQDAYSGAENNNEITQFQAALAGIGSGIIKIPEGFVSLGAELLDFSGMTENSAASVEQFFDTLNPLEEIAEQKAAGKITQALIQIGVPASIGAKVASKLATKALKAKKAGTYVNLKGKNVRKGMEKVYKLNDAARVKRFGAAVTGGAIGETFVGDVEDIGTFGDALDLGPTQLDLDELKDSQDDAGRKLLNRAKFGADSVLYFPFIFGGTKAIGKVAKFGKDLAFSSSKINKTIDTIAGAVRPTSGKPEAMFLAKNRENAAKAADSNFAMEQVKRIDKEVSKMFPTIKTFFNRTLREDQTKAQETFYKDLKELMFEGDMSKKIGNTKTFNKIEKQMRNGGLNAKSRKIVLDSVYNTRQKFVSLLETIQEGSTAKSMLPKNLKNVSGLLGDRVKLMIGGTYKIFANPHVDSLAGYKPAAESINKIKSILKRHAQKHGRDLTEDQLDYRINEILSQTTKFTKGTQLPSFKMTDVTIGAKTPDIRKSFVQTLSKKNKNGVEATQIIGRGSKAFRELFGEVDDARQSIFNGVGLLSSLASRSKFIDDVLDADEAAIKAGTRRLFYEDKNEAIKQLGAGGLNKIVQLDDVLKPMFRDGVLVNRLKGLHTTQEIAEAFDPVNKLSNFFVGPYNNKFSKGLSDAYKYTFLYPKAGAQIAKTVLSPTTHMRNFLSASSFSIANGTLFADPRLIAKAIKSAAKSVQFGLRSPEGMREYRKLLRGGVVNTNTSMGDYQALLKDLELNVDGGFSTSMFKRMLRRLARITKPFQDLYTLEDDVYKVYNYHIEKARLGNAYVKAGIKKTTDQIEDEAMDIVRNTVPNYAYVSDIVKGLRATPFSNFASFPSAVAVSGTGIGMRIFKEMKHSKPTRGGNMSPIVFEIGKGFVKNDNPLYGIGMKRLLGSATALGGIGTGLYTGFKAMFGTTDPQHDALERWVAEYEKGDTKLLSYDLNKDGKKEYYYQNWSNNNAYDYLSSPFRRILRGVQEGIETEEQLSKGFVKGLSDAFSKSIEPFVSESIAPEAIFDIFQRGGVTREGKRLYTDETPVEDRMRIIIKHITDTQIPLSKSQLTRLYYAFQGLPDPKGGQVYDLEKELPGLLGWRLIKVNPIRGLDFKITEYDRSKRNSVREFTGGDSRLLSAPATKEEVIRQFFVTNRALFNAQQKMHLDLKAANQFDVTNDELAEVFAKRLRSVSEYGPFFAGEFRPYRPSQNIAKKFEEKSREFAVANPSYKNPFEEALPTILNMLEKFEGSDLSKEWQFKLNDFEKKDTESFGNDPLLGASLPITPEVSRQALATNNMPVSQTGLTQTEQGLLSEEEKGIRLRQRGMA
jgi:hypothetical protein